MADAEPINMDVDENIDVENRITTLENSIRTSEYDTLQNHVYICFANGCILLTSFLQLQGQPGWSAELRDAEGLSVLTEQEQQAIETAFAKASWILPFFSGNEQEQEGGAGSFKFPAMNPGGNLITKTGFQFTGEDVSLDRMMQAFIQKTQELDEFWDSFGKKEPGLYKLFAEGDIRIPTPNPLITIPIPKKPLLQLLITLLDAFRLSAGVSGEKSFLLTLVVFLEELITGQWRQMLMTAAGFFSPTGMALGVVFKYIINAWQLISPDLRTDITKDLYKGTKSLGIGFLLWCATTLPPEFVRAPVEQAIEKLRKMIQSMDDKIQSLTQGAQQQLAAQGFQMTFPGLQFDQLKKISMDDIQNLQLLARWPVMVCSKEFQDILTPIKSDPIFRLVLELSNIPVLDEDRYEVCKTDKAKPLTELLVESAQPLITQQPGAAAAPAAQPGSASEPTAPVGGAKRKRTPRRRATKSKRLTRKTKSKSQQL